MKSVAGVVENSGPVIGCTALPCSVAALSTPTSSDRRGETRQPCARPRFEYSRVPFSPVDWFSAVSTWPPAHGSALTPMRIRSDAPCAPWVRS